MMKEKLTIVLLVAVMVFCGSSKGVWAPTGAEYAPPSEGTLVIAEDYGTSADGAGSWSDAGGGTITQTDDSIIVSVEDSYAHLSLPWRPRATNYIIDVGIKGWSTTQTGSTQYSGFWSLENSDGGGGNYRVHFVMRPGGDLYTTSGSAPFAQNTGHVMRLSDPTGVWAPYSAVATLNFGDSVTRDSGGGYRILENALMIEATSGRDSTVEIAWVRVYEGATSTEAPLQLATEPEPQPVWTPGHSEYVPPVGGDLVISEDYGYDEGRSGIGSWVLGGTGSIVEHSDYVTISFTTDGAGDATIELPFEPRLSDYVIDIGFKGWERLGGSTATNTSWRLNSYGSASGMSHFWRASDNTITGQNSDNTISYLQQTGYVIRLTNGNDASRRDPAMILNYGSEGEVCVEGFSWGASNANYLRLYAAATGASINDIAWIRIYENVVSTEAPLKPKKLWTPQGTTYIPPDHGTLVMDEIYGSTDPAIIGTSDPNHIGSWTTDGGGDITIASDGLILSVAGTNLDFNLPWRPSAENYVIDIAIKDWSTPNSTGSTMWSGVWQLHNVGSSRNISFITRPTDGGQLAAMVGDAFIPFLQNSEHVIRLTNPNEEPWGDNIGSVTLNFGDHIFLEGGTGGSVDANILRLRTGTGASSTFKIAWIKVYHDALSMDAPLEMACGYPGTVYLAADISGPDGEPDCYVDIYDLIELASQWLSVGE